MSDRKQWRVNKAVTRVILFRVLPGKEHAVGRNIAELCANAKIRSKDFRIYRLFGSYDLAFILDNSTLQESDFVKLGAIPSITGTNEYICYKWNPVDSASDYCTFDIQRLKDPLIAMCFLKINPTLIQNEGILPEIRFADHLKSVGSRIQMLNTLGWADGILLLSDHSLLRMSQSIGAVLPRLRYGVQETNTSAQSHFFEKTLTLIGCTLNVSSFYNKRPRRLPLTPRERNKIRIGLSLACRPQAMAKLARSARTILKVKDPSMKFGPRDLQFEVPLGSIKTLNRLVGALDRFRNRNDGLLIRTHTDIRYRGLPPMFRETPPKRRSPFIELQSSLASKLAGRGPVGAATATAIYRYNNLIQNDLLFDAFSDLLNQVTVIRNEALQSDKDAQRMRRLAGRLYQLELALNQRAQDVYLGLEESPFGAFPSGMGIQRVFKALEAFSALVLRQYQESWAGYVRLTHISDRFEHYIDVVIVPPDAVLLANSHWTLTHELMHVLQNIRPSCFNIRRLQGKLVDGKGSYGARIEIGHPWGFVLLECMADVMDFALCCPFDLEIYITKVWAYLKDVISSQQTMSQYAAYLWRTFAVSCYSRFQKNRTLDPGLFSFDETAGLLKECAKQVHRVCPLDLLYKEDERGQKHIDLIIDTFLNELIFYMPSMFESVATLLNGRNSKTNCEAAREAITNLEKGMILTKEELLHPSILAWILSGRESKRQDNRLNLTWILSLWHAYHESNLGPDVSVLNKKSKKPRGLA